MEDAIDDFEPAERSYLMKYVRMDNPNNLPIEQVVPKLEDVYVHYS